MEQTIHLITFSPTGGTRRVSELLCAGFEAKSTLTELCITEDKLKYPSIAADDLVVISIPVFAGRVPALAVERLRHIEANGAKCVFMEIAPTTMPWWKWKMLPPKWASISLPQSQQMPSTASCANTVQVAPMPPTQPT